MAAAVALVAITCLAIGSFLNVCTYRIPRGISLRRRSFCPQCHHTLSWHELIPILSYAWRGGRCSSCQGRISLKYPLIELLAGCLGLSLFFQHGLSERCVLTFAASSLLLLMCLIDWDFLIIPNELAVAGLGIGLLLHASTEASALVTAPLSSGGAVLTMFVIKTVGDRLFRNPSMGMGDVKLAAVIGLMVGFAGFVLALWMASIIGTVYGTTTAIRRPESSTGSRIPQSNPLSAEGSSAGKVPLGSFLSVVTVILLMFDIRTQEIIDSWLTLMQ